MQSLNCQISRKLSHSKSNQNTKQKLSNKKIKENIFYNKIQQTVRRSLSNSNKQVGKICNLLVTLKQANLQKSIKIQQIFKNKDSKQIKSQLFTNCQINKFVNLKDLRYKSQEKLINHQQNVQPARHNKSTDFRMALTCQMFRKPFKSTHNLKITQYNQPNNIIQNQDHFNFIEFKPSFKQLLQKTPKILNIDNNVKSKTTDINCKPMISEYNVKPMTNENNVKSMVKIGFSINQTPNNTSQFKKRNIQKIITAFKQNKRQKCLLNPQIEINRLDLEKCSQPILQKLKPRQLAKQTYSRSKKIKSMIKINKQQNKQDTICRPWTKEKRQSNFKVTDKLQQSNPFNFYQIDSRE